MSPALAPERVRIEARAVDGDQGVDVGADWMFFCFYYWKHFVSF